MPLDHAGEHSRNEASRHRADDDPFSALFFILLGKHNWDVRVHGLKALLAAYPRNKKPFPFQHAGIRFLVDRRRALLADEMGLGKTVQAILAMRAAIHAGRFQRVLVVCPKSLLATWNHEISVWAPELSVAVVHGEGKFIRIQRPHHVYITNYESVERVVLQAHHFTSSCKIKPFDLLIVDEAQNLKNPSTKKFKAICDVQAENRWALTGTPLENTFGDYRAVWRAIDPQLRSNLDDEGFLAKTKPNVLRREKINVLKDLPEKIIEVQYVELDGQQLSHYEELEALIRKDVEQRIHGLSGSNSNKMRMHIFKLITDLKKLCIYDEHSGQSAKMDWIEERMEEMHPRGRPLKECEKALIFTQFPNLVWDSWKLQTRLKDFQPLRYDASLRDEARHTFPNRFQNEEDHRAAFIGLKAGGTGLTLTRASQVIFLDQWWNPAVMEQAAARIHRFGQSRACYITSLVAENTIDERILLILERKQALFDKIMREIKEGRRSPADLEDLENALTLDDMLEALGMKRMTKTAVPS